MIKKDYLYAGSAAMLLVFVLVFFTTLKKPEENPIERRVSFIAAIANQGYWGRAALGAVEEGVKFPAKREKILKYALQSVKNHP